MAVAILKVLAMTNGSSPLMTTLLASGADFLGRNTDAANQFLHKFLNLGQNTNVHHGFLFERVYGVIHVIIVQQNKDSLEDSWRRGSSSTKPLRK
jgi:hypothetical protein